MGESPLGGSQIRKLKALVAYAFDYCLKFVEEAKGDVPLATLFPILTSHFCCFNWAFPTSIIENLQSL